eukprot:COSAG04_NODE_384_length_15390_cov_64.570158_13_plen_54_part_00
MWGGRLPCCWGGGGGGGVGQGPGLGPGSGIVADTSRYKTVPLPLFGLLEQQVV